MGIFDVFVLMVAGIGYAIGRRRGLVWQVSGIVSLGLGALCATALARPLGREIGGGSLGQLAGWVGVYAAVAACFYALTLRMKHRIDELEWGELDRRFGGLLGAFKGSLAFTIVTIVAVSLSGSVEGAVKRSASGKVLRDVVHAARIVLPDRAHEAFGPYLDRVAPERARRVEADPRRTLGEVAPRTAAAEPEPEPTSLRVEATTLEASVGRVEEPRADASRAGAAPDPFDTCSDPADPLAPPADR